MSRVAERCAELAQLRLGLPFAGHDQMDARIVERDDGFDDDVVALLGVKARDAADDERVGGNAEPLADAVAPAAP